MILAFVLKSLWRALEPRRRVYFVGLVGLLFVTGVFEMMGMLVIFGFIRGLTADPETGVRSGLGKVLDLYFQRPLSDTEFALFGSALVLGVILVKNLQALLVRHQLHRFLANLNHRIAMQLFASLMMVPYEHLLAGKLRQPREILQTTSRVLSSCFRAAAQILADGAVIAMVITLLLFVDPWLTLWAALMFGGLGVGIYRGLQAILRRMGQDEVAVGKQADHYLRDGFGGVIEARLRDNVRHFLRHFGKAFGKKERIARTRGTLARIPRAANELLLTTTITGAVIYMVFSGSNLSESLPVLGVFGFAGLRANGSMSRINSSLQSLRHRATQFRTHIEDLSRYAPSVLGSADVEAITYLADEKPLPRGRDGRLHHTLALRDVSFTYPGAPDPAIQNVSLAIQRGQFVSFCGESGGGKSTLLMLLMGLIRPTDGDVVCDDWSVFDHIRAWHRNIGYVSQTAYISPASVRENVAFGVRPDKVDDARVWRALEMAAARSFVESLPQGLDTPLRAGGTRLSGGQRQRIVIARALYHDPDVVIFDEATAALDNITEQEVTDAAVRLRGTKTVICVAHRLSTIRSSDVIHLVHAGQIVASGTFDELLDRSDLFRRMARTEREQRAS